jgi:peptidoglycan/xylan/chitin deacetylase (PgdA/CDA1 family)
VKGAGVITRLRRSAVARAALELSVVRAPLARAFAPAERLEDSGDWLIIAMYHDVPASTRAGFAAQLRLMRSLGDFVGLDDALDLLRRPIRGRWFCLTFDDGLRGAFENGASICVERGIPAAFFVVPTWIDGGPRWMSWADCRSLVTAGMDLGSHSLSHRRLAQLTAAEARAELGLSRARIEAETGHSCQHFAAPWGQPDRDYLSPRDPVLARAAGYRSFFTTQRARVGTGSSPWAVPRMRLEPHWSEAEMRYALRR